MLEILVIMQLCEAQTRKLGAIAPKISSKVIKVFSILGHFLKKNVFLPLEKLITLFFKFSWSRIAYTIIFR